MKTTKQNRSVPELGPGTVPGGPNAKAKASVSAKPQGHSAASSSEPNAKLTQRPIVTPARCEHVLRFLSQEPAFKSILRCADVRVADRGQRGTWFPRLVVEVVQALHARQYNPLRAVKVVVLAIAAPLLFARNRPSPPQPGSSPKSAEVSEPRGEAAEGQPQATAPSGSGRIAQLEAPERSFTFIEWYAEITQRYPSLMKVAEACLSVVGQLLLNDVTNPFALVMVGVPSSGKTIVLNFFDLPELIYTTDNFSPASFVSHASNIKRQELDAVDLLPRIRHRTLIARDLAPIFGAKEDDLMKTLGILTRVLDGEGLETDSGVHGKRGYKGDYLFMLLAGTTPLPPRVFKIMGNLGSRLFFLSVHSPEKSEEQLVAQNQGPSSNEKVIRCRAATSQLLRSLWARYPQGVDWDKTADPHECLRIIARCARLLSCLRGAINRWPSEPDRLIDNVPVIENPDRINCLLYNLARGHAVVCGRQQLSEADLAPVLEVTLDSAPSVRSLLVRGLLAAGGTLRTTQVEQLLRCSKPTALKEMEFLRVLGVAEKTPPALGDGRPEQQIKLAQKFSWFQSPECAALRWPPTQTQGGAC